MSGRRLLVGSGTVAAAAAMMALSAASTGRGLSHRELEEVRNAKARKNLPPQIDAPANLPGETNRQYAARMKAEKSNG